MEINDRKAALNLAVEDQKILDLAAFGPSRDSGAHSNVAELEAIYVHPQSWDMARVNAC